MKQVLIIGCGNIGAFYDFENEEFQTYAKAFSIDSTVNVWIHDLDEVKMNQVASKYNYTALVTLDHINWKDIDILCIASITSTHKKYLDIAFKATIKTVICEKPVANTLEELYQLERTYSASSSKILVNYIRRFQPSYIHLKTKLKELSGECLPNVVIINYCRGILNNGSHALDLVEFLLNIELSLSTVHVKDFSFDVFPLDPTVNLEIQEDNFEIKMNGHALLEKNIFEIHFMYNNVEVSMIDSGDIIIIKDLATENSETTMHAIKNYMLPVLQILTSISENSMINDNFIQSLTLNKKIISLIHTHCNG